LKKIYSLTETLIAPKNLSPGEKFYFDGTRPDGKVQGWILRPPNFEPSKKYSLAFIIHGGPQSAFSNAWSTRWNPNTYTGAGYIVVMINFTGSTGFGQQFCDDIKHEWGGRPFKDLVAGLEYVLKEYKEIDRERMAALGASFGGCEFFLFYFI
jgi:dipeptidyl aminopeptidase/acylaminoacyl peptidase